MADFTGTFNRPQSHGYQRALSVSGPSPGPSPLLKPTTPGTEVPYSNRHSMARLSTASLGAKSDGRAPSAYLEDLFDVPPIPDHSAGGESRRPY